MIPDVNKSISEPRYIYFALEAGSSSWISRLVKWRTLSRYCHVELYNPYEGYVIGSHPVGGVDSDLIYKRFRKPVIYKLNMAFTQEEYIGIMEYAQGFIGRPYNYAGIWGFIVNRFFSVSTGFQCAEFVFKVLKDKGIILLNKEANQVTPQDIIESPYVFPDNRFDSEEL